MSDTSQWHYTDKTGTQTGPVSTEELYSLLTSNSIPTTSMVWKEGMPGWKSINQIQEFAIQPASPVNPAPVATPQPPPTLSAVSTETPAPTINPYEAPTIPNSEEYYSCETADYGGIGRLAYFLISIVVSIAIGGGKFAMGASEYAAKGSQVAQDNLPIVLGFAALSIFTFFYLMFARFKNIGMSRWWALGLFAPILNIFVSIWLISRQGAWVETQRLDTAGKIIAWLCWGFTILTIIAIAAVAVVAFQAASAQQTSMLF